MRRRIFLSPPARFNLRRVGAAVWTEWPHLNPGFFSPLTRGGRTEKQQQQKKPEQATKA